MSAQSNDLGFLRCDRPKYTGQGQSNDLGFIIDDSVSKCRGAGVSNDLGFIFDDCEDTLKHHKSSSSVRATIVPASSSSTKASKLNGLDSNMQQVVDTFVQEGFTNITGDEVHETLKKIGQSLSREQCGKIAQAIRQKAKN